MAITDRDRSDLLAGLEANLGPRQADTLMQLLPAQPASQLVTIPYFQTEMAAFRSEIRGEFAEFRAEIRLEIQSEFGAVRSEIGDLRGEFNDLYGEFTGLRGEFGELRTELKGDVLRVENSLSLRIANLETTTARIHSSLTRWMFGLGVVNVATLVTALVA